MALEIWPGTYSSLAEGYCHEIWAGKKGGGELEFVGGLIGVGYGEILVKGGRALLSISLLW